MVPFVAIGWAVDYFTRKVDSTGELVGPGIVQSFVELFWSAEFGYGFLIFLGFLMLAIFQGISEYSWQTLGYNSTRFENGCNKSLIAMEASYYDMRQTGQIMSVLGADVNQLEDVVVTLPLRLLGL